MSPVIGYVIAKRVYFYVQHAITGWIYRYYILLSMSSSIDHDLNIYLINQVVLLYNAFTI
jgi:hypothetical protein